MTFYWLRKLEYPQKTIDLPQVTDKLRHIMLYLVQLTMSGIQTHSSNYHLTMTAPDQYIAFLYVSKAGTMYNQILYLKQKAPHTKRDSTLFDICGPLVSFVYF
jgi:hypothetical protein